ncbi:MAG TPA: quinone-dependent dihydroorotate dehydrogenase [Actinomycetales bacterium]|nr:quinone-dependent dihydroorotate dehydrogenase [Actinomycetales bacterium]
MLSSGAERAKAWPDIAVVFTLVYSLLFRQVFARMDPELAHGLAFGLIRCAGASPLRGLIAAMTAAPAGGAIRKMGIDFPSRFGLAAGFDKDGQAVRGLAMLGFGFVEIGTLTAHKQPGNEKPRLWRRIAERALINRMGFNNGGAARAAVRLRRLRAKPIGREIIIGVNIGKTKIVPESEAISDYKISARLLAPYADYLVVNVSSPNTPGLRNLQAVETLRPLLSAVAATANKAAKRSVPLLVKIAPDLADDDIEKIADLVNELDIAGVVAVNTTIDHDHGVGGMSGPPVFERGVDVVRLLRSRLGVDRTIIGVGGISSADDARAYLDAGADLLQGYTGLIYEGPFWAARLNKQIAAA